MEVILMESVAGVGKAGETHKVADGYARNYLLPRRLAVEATKGNLRNLEKIRTDAEQREAEARTAAEKVLAAVDGQRITMPARVSPDGAKLYGSITGQDIATALEQKTGQAIDKRNVLTDALKQTGVFDVPVRVYAGLVGHVTVVVHPEGQQPPPPELDKPAPPEEVAPPPVPVAEAPAEETPSEAVEAAPEADEAAGEAEEAAA
jgi:large subunit ribosomal protein L9